MGAATFHSLVPDLLPFPIPAALRGALARAVGLEQIGRVYDALGELDSRRSIADRLLEFLAVSFSVSEVDLANVPGTGPALLTANHPFGILEGAVLTALLAQIRPDARILANGILANVPELRDVIIAVDPMSGRSAVSGNGSGLRRSLEHLESGGLLVVFPAGEVSHFRWRERAVADPEWNTAVARMVSVAARKGCRPQVVPAYISGANSPLFHLAGMAHPAFRTALLARELLNKRGRRVEVRIGTPVAADKLLAMPGAREQTEYLRWRTYLLASREPFKARTSIPLLARRRTAAPRGAIAEAAPADVMAAEVATLPGDSLLERSGELEARLATAAEIPNTLREIGRLREITFRAAGEGTGNALDLDEFDVHYLHLFIWNAEKREVVGAYRLAPTDVVRNRAGVRGLYTATLFEYGDPFLDRLGPALELGRSFVREEYQRGFAPLLLLWKGIGGYVGRNPQYKVLFGPVSISNQYEAASRELMVSFLEKYALLREWGGLVRNRQAFRGRILKGGRRPAFPQSGFDIEDLSTVMGDVEGKRTGVPVLLRQYMRLGGRLLGFNVDPKFSNALDGLILVDLTKTEKKLLERYLGKAGAGAFLEYQKGRHGTQ